MTWRKIIAHSSNRNARSKRVVEVGERIGFRCAVLVVLLTLSTASMADDTDNHKNIRFNIARQRADKALTLFAEQANLTLIFPFDKVRDRTANRLVGVYSLEAAVEILLMGTGLKPTFKDPLVLSIEIDDEEERAMNSKKSILTAVIGFLFGTSGAAEVAAQEGGEKKATIRFELEEIIVTAEKRAESAHDMPIAISAFSGESMKSAGVTGIADLKQVAQSLQVGGEANTTFVSIRGIGSEVPNIGGEAGVSISQDNVAFSRSMFLDADFMDVERVEVLRGPQGTISGRNATGGGIKIYSKRPTEDFEGSFKATTGSYNLFATESTLSGPIAGEKLLGRLAISTERADGWLNNTLLDQELETRDKVHARVSFLTRPSDDVEVLLILEGMNDRSTPQGQMDNGRARPDEPSVSEFFDVPAPDFDKLEFEGNLAHKRRIEQYGATLGVTWDISQSMTLVSTTGYLSRDSEASFDYDGTRVVQTQNPFIGFDIWQVSQELTLTADLTDRLDLILGGLYLQDSAEEPVNFVSEVIGITEFSSLPFGGPVQDLTSYSVYSQLRYRLTDALRFSVGARYTDDTKKYESYGIVFNGADAGDLWRFDEEKSWDAFTPRVSVDYSLSDSITIFANVARGFKSGGFNTYSNPADDFNPEFVWSYEAGLKLNGWEGRVRAAVTGFSADYKDLQQNVFRSIEDGVPTATIENAAAAKISGVELEVEALVGDSLKLNTAVTWLDATFEELNSEDSIFPELGVADLSGNQLVRAPDWQFNIGAEYTAHFSNGMIGVLRTDYQWQDRVFFDFFNHDLVDQDAYGVLNVHAVVETMEGRWQLSAFARNALDERFITHASTGTIGTFSQYAVVGTPRTYGLSFAFNF